MAPNLHIFGIQGSGKDTQAARLAAHFGLVHLSSGGLFRARSEVADPLGTLIKESMQSGHLLPDEFLYEVVDEALNALPPKTGIIGAGLIRTISQLEGFAPRWTAHNLGDILAIELQVSDESAIKRAEARSRSDDTPQALAERFKTYHEQTGPVLDRLRAENSVLTLDGERDIESITNELIALLPQRIPTLHGTH